MEKLKDFLNVFIKLGNFILDKRLSGFIISIESYIHEEKDAVLIHCTHSITFEQLLAFNNIIKELEIDYFILKASNNSPAKIVVFQKYNKNEN